MFQKKKLGLYYVYYGFGTYVADQIIVETYEVMSTCKHKCTMQIKYLLY